MSFTIYIDESGDAGISKIASPQSGGSSPYFVLGAVVCQPTAEIHAKNAISLARETFGKKKWKHATQLGHFERVYLARELGRLPVRYFAVVSNKHTLGDYGSDIEWDPHKFYNKCIVYLLEIICSYLSNVVFSENDLRVVLERRNHNYDRLIR